MQAQLEDYLAKLVAIQSTTGNTKECRRLVTTLAAECEDLGLHTTVYDGQHPSFVATTQRTKHPKVLMVTHGDVIPSSNPELFKLKAVDDKLVGRGTYDMKFAIATAMQFFRTHKDELKKYDIGLMVTTDEEIGGLNGAAMLIDKGWRADVVVVPDGGENWKLEGKAKGILLTRMIARGESAHGARPWEGQNAIEKLMCALEEVKKHFKNESKTGVMASINKIIGGSAMNQVPEHAEAYIDFRAFSEDEFSLIRKTLNAIEKKCDVAVSEVVYGSPVRAQESHPMIQEFYKTFETLHGKKPQTTDSYGATDARWFAEIGVPSIIIRPRGGDPHGPAEWLNRDDLPLFYKTLEDYLRRAGQAKVTSTTPAVDKLIDTVANR